MHLQRTVANTGVDPGFRREGMPCGPRVGRVTWSDSSPVDVTEVFSLCRFGLDALLTAAAAWLLLRALDTRGGVIEQVLGWALAFLLIVAASGQVLGWAGVFGAPGFLLSHAILLVVLAAGRRKSLAADIREWGELRRRVTAQFRPGDAAARLGATLLLVFAGLAVLAALGEPMVYDALTYRLSRIGLWLQDGRIAHLATDEARINYMPVVPDIMMAWLLGAHDAGFQWAPLAQTFGGGLLLGATAGLARGAGLSRVASLGAAALLFGMANVAPQFTSLHTDLFTAGVFAASFYLWLAALRRGEGSLAGGLGAGLALGCKGTMLYLGPGALLWVGWLAWRHPVAWRGWTRTLAAGVLGAGLFAAPVHWRNWREFGGLLGPTEYVAQHHAGGFAEKLGLNLRSAFVQNFDPNSQPWGLQSVAAAVGRRLAAAEPADDRLVWENMRRRTTLGQIMERATPDADVTSFGLVPLALFGLGVCLALGAWRRDETARLVAIWAAGLLVFFVFFHGMQRWHPFGFRYLVLMAPWIAVVAAWGIERQRRGLRLFLWGGSAWAVASVLWIQNTHAAQAGWRAVVEPETSRVYHVYRHWKEWADALPEGGGALTVALPANRPLAAFFRGSRWPGVTLTALSTVQFKTAEDFSRAVGGGWVVVPATRFLGSEGAVQARVWLDGGAEAGGFSLAAYRLLRSGETPAGLVYRRHREADPGGVKHSFLVKTWTAAEVPLVLRNPGAVAWRYECLTPSGRQAGVLSAHDRIELRLPLAAAVVSEVKVRFEPVAAHAGTVQEPEAELPAPASPGNW